MRDITDCSNGAFLLEGSCFKYIATNKSWSDANKFCHDMNGGHLAIVDSASIFDKIKSMAIQRNTKYMWLGANDNDHNGVYQWVNGHRCCPNFWIPGQPDNGGGNQRCLALWQNEKDVIGFDDGTCETKVRFVCQSKGCQSIQHCISHTCLNDVPTCNACENGFAPVGYPSHCFDLTSSTHLKCFVSCLAVFTTRLSWNDAKNVCKSRGGQIYVPENSDDDDRLRNYLEAVLGTVDNFWVGGQLLQTLKQQWLSGLPPTHARWSSLPTSLNEDKCIAMEKNENYRLGTFSCDELFPFICQEKSLYVPNPIG